ncbi:MAG: glucose-6-phosphate dehydrogenase assembly protein OpcA [Chthoniobacterales bacterium]
MTASTTAPSPPGLPVDIGDISRELKKLWDDGDAVRSRASLINLAVYSEAPGSLAANTELIAKITEDHACRAIVIAANPGAEKSRVQAWISAHCHVGGAGARQVCSEQISFLLEGASAVLLPGLVFSQLDSDLPLYLWWQGEFHEPMDPQLWAWVDRLIYDSQLWSDFAAQMLRVETAQSEAKQRVVLCDLNWTRLVQVRLAVAQFFDDPRAQQHLSEIDQVEIDFASGFHSTATLLLGWLAAQLRWSKPAKSGRHSLTFEDARGKRVAVALAERAGRPISRCLLCCGKLSFCVTHPSGHDLLNVSCATDGADRMNQLLPAGREDAVELVHEELMRGGPHRVYVRALNCVRNLL